MPVWFSASRSNQTSTLSGITTCRCPNQNPRLSRFGRGFSLKFVDWQWWYNQFGNGVWLWREFCLFPNRLFSSLMIVPRACFYQSVLCYNHSKHFSTPLKRTEMKNRKKYPCTIKGVYYESEQVAANALGINTATLRSRLSSQKFPEYTSEYYHKIRLYRASCVVAGVEYESIIYAVKKLGISYGEMIKRLHSFDYPDYVSARHPKIKYAPKNPSRTCTINGVEYKSLTDAAKDLGISNKSLKNRLLSPNFPDHISKHYPKRPRKFPDPKTQSCTIDGVKYKSLTGAANDLGISLPTLRNRLFSPKFPGYMSEHYSKRLEKIKKYACVINGTEYESLSAAANDLGISKETLKYRLRSPNFPGYISEHHPKRLERKAHSCTINGVEYKSLTEAAKDLGITGNVLKNRLRSPNFPDHISQHCPKRPRKPPERKTRSCTIGGIEYESLSSAARDLGISKTALKNRLRSSNFPGYISKHHPKYLEKNRKYKLEK